METSTEQTTQTTQTTRASHLHFQMWDKHLSTLNTIWNLAQEQTTEIPPTHFHTTLWNQHLASLNQSWHVSSTLPLQPPSSFLGKLLFPFKKMILRWMQPAIDSIIQQQNDLNARVVQTCNGLVELTNQEAVRRIEAQTELNAQLVQCLNTLVELTSSELERLRGEVSQHLTLFQNHLDTLQTHIDTFQTHLNARLEQITPQLQEFQTMIWTFDRRKEALELEQIRFNHKLEQIFALLRSQPTQMSETVREQLPETENQQEYAYLLFENLYRGNEEMIKQRQEIYLPYFEGRQQVLDIGCGRGEFLELLQEQQIGGKGIDANQIMIQYCQKKQLDVEHSDALSYLESLADESLDGIFAAQFVEHCSPQHLSGFLQLCYAKLQPQTYLVLETQNPQSLFALSHFYRDLSHDKPVHPDALQYLLKTIGFEDLRVEYLSPLPQSKMLQELEIPKEIHDSQLHTQITTLNHNIRQLNEVIYGHLDYAVVARKIHLF